MAIRRTHTQQKSQVQSEKISLTYSLPVTQPGTSDKTNSVTRSTQDLFGYPTTFIYRDIIKTVVISLITIGMLVAITLRTRFF